MDHYEMSELTDSFRNIDSIDDFVNCWLLNQTRMNGFLSLYTFDDGGSDLPFTPIMGNHDGEKFFIRSVFSKSNIYILSQKIWLDMFDENKDGVLPLDCVLSLDTQFGKYALDYIKKEKFRNSELGISFAKLLRFVVKNKINPEFTFYLKENYGNYLSGKEKEIKNQIYALVKIVDMDKDLFLSNGEIKYMYSADTLNSRVENILSTYKNGTAEEAYSPELKVQSAIACLILKAALLRRASLSNEEKVLELVNFCEYKISAILLRELYILSLWLLGEEFDFFNPINGGDGLHYLPQRLNGMAWDFMLCRHVEMYCSKEDPEKYTIAYYASFDRRMIDVTDVYKNRGCLFPPRELFGRFFMVSDFNIDKFFEKVIGTENYNQIFNSSSWENRDNRRSCTETIESLRKAMEYELIKELDTKKSRNK